MIRSLAIAVALALAGAAACAPGARRRGAPTVEELRREPIRFELDVPYAATDHPRQRLDLYLPETPAAPASRGLPVIVYLHGGGWLQGDKSEGAAQLLPFVRGGAYAGVSVNYRLSREAPWPAQIHDSKAAIRWIRAHADDHGLDARRIAVWGRSAGAHLALLLGTTGDVPELEGEVGPHTGESSAVYGVVNFFGVTDLPAILDRRRRGDRAGPRSPADLLLGGAPADAERARAASPITYVTPGDAPVLTLHGSEDRTVPYDQAVRLHRALGRAGVPSWLVPVRGAGHGGFPDAALERAATFLARVLLGEEVEISTRALEK